MKTNKNLSLRKALLTTVAVAGLVAGTAACGGKTNSSAEAETAKQELIDDLLDAARKGADADELAEIIGDADPNVVAQVMPQIEEELDIVMPEIESSPETDVAPEASTPETEVAPEASAPETEVAPEESAPESEVTPEESAPESGSDDSDRGELGDLFPDIDFPDIDLPGSDPDFDIDLPEISVPDLDSLSVTAPNVEFVSFWDRGLTTEAWIVINEGGGHVLSNVTSVKISYRLGLITVTKNATLDTELDNDIFRWKATNTTISSGAQVTITVTNAFGLTDTFVITAEVSAPL